MKEPRRADEEIYCVLCLSTNQGVSPCWPRHQTRREFSRAPRRLGAPSSLTNTEKCSRWLLSHLTSNVHKIHFLGSFTTLPWALVEWWGDTPPQISSLSTPLASRSRRIRNELMIGPLENGFPGPAVALDGPARHEVLKTADRVCFVLTYSPPCFRVLCDSNSLHFCV